MKTGVRLMVLSPHTVVGACGNGDDNNFYYSSPSSLSAADPLPPLLRPLVMCFEVLWEAEDDDEEEEEGVTSPSRAELSAKPSATTVAGLSNLVASALRQDPSTIARYAAAYAFAQKRAADKKGSGDVSAPRGDGDCADNACGTAAATSSDSFRTLRLGIVSEAALTSVAPDEAAGGGTAAEAAACGGLRPIRLLSEVGAGGVDEPLSAVMRLGDTVSVILEF